MKPEFYKLPNKTYSFEITITSKGTRLYQAGIEAEVLPDVSDSELRSRRQNHIIKTVEELLVWLKTHGDFNDLLT